MVVINLQPRYCAMCGTNMYRVFAVMLNARNEMGVETRTCFCETCAVELYSILEDYFTHEQTTTAVQVDVDNTNKKMEDV